MIIKILFWPKFIITTAIISTAITAIYLKKIDLKGGITGIALSFIIWLGSGEIALLALFTFFVLGTLASSWKKEKKLQLKLYQENDGKRSIRNVLNNGGVAGFISFIAFVMPEHHTVLMTLILSCFATACSDTLSSELGNIYGSRYYNIINWKVAKRGIDGAVSLEGFGFGILGSVFIAFIPMLFQPDITMFLIISLSGFLGNIIDSILGATLQQKNILNNHSVNFVATLSSAGFSFLVFQIFH